MKPRVVCYRVGVTVVPQGCLPNPQFWTPSLGVMVSSCSSFEEGENLVSRPQKNKMIQKTKYLLLLKKAQNYMMCVDQNILYISPLSLYLRTSTTLSFFTSLFISLFVSPSLTHYLSLSQALPYRKMCFLTSEVFKTVLFKNCTHLKIEANIFHTEKPIQVEPTFS